MKTYNLFVIHSWGYVDQYERLVNLLNRRGYFAFKDYSVSPDDPILNAGSDSKLKHAIKNHIRPCHVVLALAGVYATYSKWIDIEIDLAKRGFKNPKPIIAIKPRGNILISKRVGDAADDEVAWNTESVVKAIRKLA